jgi:transcriptional regulator with XRE-family HTH domain
MSTDVTNFSPDSYGRLVAEGVTENAIFSAFYNLVSQRKVEGLSKADLAERMGSDRATVTKLTSAPSNMKISTMASLANALGADVLFLLVDRSNSGYIYSSIGTYTSPSYFQSISASYITYTPHDNNTHRENLIIQEVVGLSGG